MKHAEEHNQLVFSGYKTARIPSRDQLGLLDGEQQLVPPRQNLRFQTGPLSKSHLSSLQPAVTFDLGGHASVGQTMRLDKRVGGGGVKGLRVRLQAFPAQLLHPAGVRGGGWAEVPAGVTRLSSTHSKPWTLTRRQKRRVSI